MDEKQTEQKQNSEKKEPAPRKGLTGILDRKAIEKFVVNMQRAANQIIVSRLAAYLSRAGRYADEGGLPFYPFLKSFEADFAGSLEKMQQVFAGLLPKLFNRHGLIVSVTLKQEEYPAFEEAFGAL